MFSYRCVLLKTKTDYLPNTAECAPSSPKCMPAASECFGTDEIFQSLSAGFQLANLHMLAGWPRPTLVWVVTSLHPSFFQTFASPSNVFFLQIYVVLTFAIPRSCEERSSIFAVIPKFPGPAANNPTGATRSSRSTCSSKRKSPPVPKSRVLLFWPSGGSLENYKLHAFQWGNSIFYHTISKTSCQTSN